jgi:inorganic pyrophosphatase
LERSDLCYFVCSSRSGWNYRGSQNHAADGVEKWIFQKYRSGRNPPVDLNAVAEIPPGGVPVKYELDKTSGAMFVDRFLHTAMFYPVYGFIPHTLSEDAAKQDEAGMDEKVLAVPVDDLHPFYSNIRNYTDLPSVLTEQIAHFF